jgi:hypothetical protein
MGIFINERDVAALVYQVCELDGHLAPIVPQVATIALANSAGAYGTTVTVNPRQVRIGLDVRPSSLVDRQTIMDTIKRRLGGLLEVQTDDLPGRVLRGMLTDVAVEFYTGAFANPPVYVTLTITAIDPARHDVEPLLYGLSTARASCPVGTDTSAPQVWLYGAATPVVSPVVIVRSHTGAEVSRLTFNASLAANDAIVIDSGRQQITRFVAGVAQSGGSSGLASLTSGRFPILSPEDASMDGDVSPTVEITAASGTPTGLILYTRRW